jgi:sec-independent protein translocase protein TatB
MGEISVIVLLALIILGPKKLPELASGLGKLIREIRKTTSDVKNEIQLDDTIRKPFEELREAVTLHPDELKRRDRIKRELKEAAAKLEEVTAAAEKDLAEIASKAGITEAGNPDATTVDATAAATPDLPPGVTPPPFVVPPFVAPPPVPPSGTVSRTTTPVLPPSLSRPLGTARAGSELSRTLTGLSDARREAQKGVPSTVDSSLFGPPPSGPVAVPPVQSAADRANATQILSDSDLAAVAIGEGLGMPPAAPPPPPPAARTTGRSFLTAGPRLPGATPPKQPPAETPAKPEDKKSETTG